MIYNKVFLASDHRGFVLKQDLISYLFARNINFEDFGVSSEDVSVDYPDYVKKMINKLKTSDNKTLGILICASGIGMSIAANRYKNIRAALCTNIENAMNARKHNNANILVLGSKNQSKDMAVKMLDIFLNTGFEAGRHLVRLSKIEK